MQHSRKKQNQGLLQSWLSCTAAWQHADAWRAGVKQALIADELEQVKVTATGLKVCGSPCT